jgi:hypothetical protein
VRDVNYIIIFGLLSGVSQGKKPGQESGQADQKEEKEKTADQGENKRKEHKAEENPLRKCPSHHEDHQKEAAGQKRQASQHDKKTATLCANRQAENAPNGNKSS